MINQTVALILRHAANTFEDTPDQLPDDQRRFAGMIIDGLEGRSYTVAVCEVRTAGGRPVHAVPPTPSRVTAGFDKEN